MHTAGGFDEEVKSIDDMPRFSVAFQSQAPRLLNENEMNRLKDDFNHNCENALDDAKRRQQPTEAGIPWWFLIMFIYFAYDDILRMFLSPWIFYPMMLPITIISLLYTMGLGPMINPMLQGSVNMWFRQAGIPY